MKAARQVACERGEVRRLVDGLNASRFDPRKVEQRIDQLEQPQCVAVEHLQLGRRAVAGEQVLERREHQRERSPKFVAHVAEERRLGAVDLRQRLRALALRLAGERIGDGGGDVLCRELEEAVVLVVQRAPRAHAGDEETVRVLQPRPPQGQNERGVRRPGIGPSREKAEPADKVVHDDRPRLASGASERPLVRAFRVEDDDRRHDFAAHVVQPSAADPMRACAVRAEQVEERERHVRGARGQGSRGVLAGLLRRLGVGRDAGQVTESPQAPLALDALRSLRNNREHPADATALVADGAVRQREEALLEVPVAVERDEHVVERHRLTRERLAKERPDHVPDFGEDVDRAAAERHRMLGHAEHGTIAIVVEKDELGTPRDDDGEPRRQHDADRGAKALRPRADGSERGLGPVHRPHQRTQLATTGKAVFRAAAEFSFNHLWARRSLGAGP